MAFAHFKCDPSHAWQTPSQTTKGPAIGPGLSLPAPRSTRACGDDGDGDALPPQTEPLLPPIRSARSPQAKSWTSSCFLLLSPASTTRRSVQAPERIRSSPSPKRTHGTYQSQQKFSSAYRSLPPTKIPPGKPRPARRRTRPTQSAPAHPPPRPSLDTPRPFPSPEPLPPPSSHRTPTHATDTAPPHPPPIPHPAAPADADKHSPAPTTSPLHSPGRSALPCLHDSRPPPPSPHSSPEPLPPRTTEPTRPQTPPIRISSTPSCRPYHPSSKACYRL